MKKVLFVSENYFPNVSGVPVVVQYLAEGLVDNGYEVSIATTLHENLETYEILNKVHIYRFYLFQNSLKKYCGDIDTYLQFVKNFTCDVLVVECAHCITTDLLLPCLKQMTCKKIFHSHGFAGLSYRPFEIKSDFVHTVGNTYNWLRWRFYLKFYLKKFIKDFDSTLCLSKVDSSLSYLKKYSQEVNVLENAVADIFIDKTDEIKPTFPLPSHYFVSIANFVEYKNQLGILKEFYLSKASDKYALILIGREFNDYAKKIMSSIDALEKKYGKKDIRVFWGVDRKYIPYIISHSSLYLVGSTFEEYSISLIESMSKGIPFLSTNVGNARILPGGITLNTINDMHIEIDRLCSSVDLSNRLSKQGNLYVNTHCLKSIAVNNVIKIIEEL